MPVTSRAQSDTIAGNSADSCKECAKDLKAQRPKEDTKRARRAKPADQSAFT